MKGTNPSRRPRRVLAAIAAALGLVAAIAASPTAASAPSEGTPASSAVDPDQVEKYKEKADKAKEKRDKRVTQQDREDAAARALQQGAVNPLMVDLEAAQLIARRRQLGRAVDRDVVVAVEGDRAPQFKVPRQ